MRTWTQADEDELETMRIAELEPHRKALEEMGFTIERDLETCEYIIQTCEDED
jgi:hypothetical protein